MSIPLLCLRPTLFADSSLLCAASLCNRARSRSRTSNRATSLLSSLDAKNRTRQAPLLDLLPLVFESFVLDFSLARGLLKFALANCRLCWWARIWTAGTSVKARTMMDKVKICCKGYVNSFACLLKPPVFVSQLIALAWWFLRSLASSLSERRLHRRLGVRAHPQITR